MKNLILLACALVTPFSWSFAQDLSLPNSNYALIHLNPSFAGSNGGIRNQFASQVMRSEFSGSPWGFVNTIDAYLNCLNAGLAVSVSANQIGPLLNRKAGVTYAQYLSFYGGKVKLVPSIQFSYGQRILSRDWVPSTTSTGQPANYLNNYFDLGSGLLLNYREKLYVGGSIYHLNNPDMGLNGYSPLPNLLTLHASYNLQLSEQSQLQFTGRYINQLHYSSGTLAANLVLYKHMIMGIGCMGRDGTFFNLGYKGDYFSITGGYQTYVSRLAYYSTNYYQLNASFNLRSKGLRKALTSFESW
jgi:type IX secretion system PorP/SprF family membrane protein